MESTRDAPKPAKQPANSPARGDVNRPVVRATVYSLMPVRYTGHGRGEPSAKRKTNGGDCQESFEQSRKPVLLGYVHYSPLHGSR